MGIFTDVHNPLCTSAALGTLRGIVLFVFAPIRPFSVGAIPACFGNALFLITKQLLKLAMCFSTYLNFTGRLKGVRYK